MLPLSDILALGAAMSWALSGLLSASPAQHLGAIGFVRWRMSTVTLMLWFAVLFLDQPFQTITPYQVWIMAWSGMIGIFIGDIALYAAMNRMGPRRAGVIFATHALFSAFFGFVFLQEHMGVQGYVGALVAVAGVMIAVGTRRETTSKPVAIHPWEAQPLTLLGVVLALVAACCQASGAIIAKPLLVGDSAIHPLLASAIRVSCATLALWLWRMSGHNITRLRHPLNIKVMAQATLSSAVGVGIGMGCLLWALKTGDVGVVGVLSSLSPILILPLLWMKIRQAPAKGAWFGAVIAMMGVTLVLLR